MDARQAVRKSLAAERARDFPEAARVLTEALAEHDTNAMLWTRLGHVQRELRQSEAAISSFKRAIAAQPALAHAHSGLGWAYVELGAWTEAAAAFEQSLALKPVSYHFASLGHVRFHQHRVDEAEQLYRQALERDPDYDEAMYMLAVILHLYRKKSAQAIMLLRRALVVDPNYALAYRVLGEILSRQGQHSEAEQCLLRSLALDDKDVWTYLELGNTVWAMGRESDAEDDYRRACQVAPDSAVASWTLASAYEAREEFDAALVLYRKAADQDAGDPIAVHRLARLLVRRGDSAAARSCLQRYLEMNPDGADDPNVKRLLAELA